MESSRVRSVVPDSYLLAKCVYWGSFLASLIGVSSSEVTILLKWDLQTFLSLERVGPGRLKFADFSADAVSYWVGELSLISSSPFLISLPTLNDFDWTALVSP